MGRNVLDLGHLPSLMHVKPAKCVIGFSKLKLAPCVQDEGVILPVYCFSLVKHSKEAIFCPKKAFLDLNK